MSRIFDAGMRRATCLRQIDLGRRRRSEAVPARRPFDRPQALRVRVAWIQRPPRAHQSLAGSRSKSTISPAPPLAMNSGSRTNRTHAPYERATRRTEVRADATAINKLGGSRSSSTTQRRVRTPSPDASVKTATPPPPTFLTPSTTRTGLRQWRPPLSPPRKGVVPVLSAMESQGQRRHSSFERPVGHGKTEYGKVARRWELVECEMPRTAAISGPSSAMCSSREPPTSLRGANPARRWKQDRRHRRSSPRSAMPAMWSSRQGTGTPSSAAGLCRGRATDRLVAWAHG